MKEKISVWEQEPEDHIDEDENDYQYFKTNDAIKLHETLETIKKDKHIEVIS